MFLKEHSRGLYTNFVQWVVASLPLYSLQIVNAVLYSVVVYSILGFNTDSGMYSGAIDNLHKKLTEVF